MENYQSELQLQAKIYQWFYNFFPEYRVIGKNKKLIRCLLIHNLLNPKSKVEAAKLKGSGLTKGLPDMTLLIPKGKYHGMFIELKIGNNKPTIEQLEMFEALRIQGYYVTWVSTLEKARKEITDYLNS